MKKHFFFLTLLFVVAFSFTGAKAQYTKLLDFNGTVNGSYPYGSLISDGTYLYGMTYEGGANDLGTVFKIQISNNSYTKILDFAGAENGSYPQGSLISDGTYLYGMTSEGGANSSGTAFKIEISNNAYTKILDFASTANGNSPFGSLISDGTYLYGMASGGGVYTHGTAFKIQISNNAYTKILDFDYTETGCNPNGSFISDGIYLYGMTNLDGANGMGTAFKIQISNNTYTKILDFDGTENGSYPTGSFISDGTYLYGMTNGGGPIGVGTAFKIQLSNNAYTKILDFTGTANGGSPYGSFISDGTYLYGMTSEGGLYNFMGTVFKIQISNNAYTKILDFEGENGRFPIFSNLLLNSPYLYGMTYTGGYNNNGTVFKYRIYSPEINVKQGALSIPDNSGVYNFGNVKVGTSVTTTFTIENIGNWNLNLTGTPKVVVSGVGYSLAVDAETTVSVGGTTTFQITFTPNTTGLFNGTISIANDDYDENPYNFVIKGTGALPEINVTGNSVSIVDGDIVPSFSDYTNFGNVLVEGSLVRTFTIENAGNGALNITTLTTNGANADLFIVGGIALPAIIPAGGNTTYTVTYSPLATGTHIATLNITNDDLDETIYDFAITGNGTNTKTDQTITFTPFTTPLIYGAPTFDLTATGGDSGNSVTFASDNDAVAIISGNIVTVVGVGTANITASQVGNDNYNAAPDVTMNLVVNKATLTTTAIDATRVYGIANPSFEIVYTGFVLSDDVTVINTLPFATCDAVSTSPVGQYSILVSGGNDNNYGFDYVPGTLTITSGVGVSTIENPTINIYPNPATSIFTINSSTELNLKEVEVTDITGSLIIKSTSQTIDLSAFANGIYFVKIISDKGMVLKKIVKQ